jgi:ElaB/YqjD/DUF883 family membrane-anchored ribosome-binding protein
MDEKEVEDVTPVDRAKEKVRETIDTARVKLQEATKEAGERYQRVSQDVRREAERVSEKAREQYGVAKEQLREGYTRVRKDVGEISEDLSDFVRDNPGKAVLLAAGIGFVIGLLFRGERREA